MLTYHLDPQSKTPLYEQLYRAIRADIMSGALAGGARLPSKRKLAANLRVSQVTVETAYGQLLAEGYLVSVPRRGYFVQRQLAVPAAPSPAPAAAPPQSTPADGCRYDFRTNIVDTDCFPFSVWARLSRSVLSEYSDRLLQAADPCGAIELRVQIARYLHDFRGINVSPDNILVGAGSEYLMHLVIQLLGGSAFTRSRTRATASCTRSLPRTGRRCARCRWTKAACAQMRSPRATPRSCT